MQDQYSETEIEWGLWNGQQLYRRCFTVSADITSTSTITTWDSGLTPKGLTGYTNSGTWNFPSSYANSGTDRALITYNDVTGAIQAVINGTGRQISAGTSHCMDYTK